MTTMLAGLVLGVAGGAHCTAMCGPLIALASPRGWNAVLHHLGRSVTYVVLGLAAGSAGAGAAAAGFGRWVAWTAAACLVIQGLAPSVLSATRGRSRGTQAIVDLVGRVRRMSGLHPRTGAFVLGTLNGLLPCGLTYAATIAAIGTGSIGTGALLMAGFAAGTTVILSTAGVLWARVATRLPIQARRLSMAAFAAVALLLVWRGWSAGAFGHMH
jgi:sulfite exporter TauE/SafE